MLTASQPVRMVHSEFISFVIELFYLIDCSAS